jgi:glycosyltransferase involved in cell wall biosynthesis
VRPLVSVLTPSFRQAAWIGDNLRSVAGQTYPAIEHIVMDGGSTDGTLDVLRRDAGPRVTWRSEPDQGQSHALNKAFRLSRGDIIGWLNSDDAYFGPGVVADVVSIFEAEPDVDVVYGHAVLVDGDGLVLQVLWAPPFNRRLLRLQDFIIQPTAFVRREILGEQLADESFDHAMDYELWLRLARRHRFERLNRVLAVDRNHGARKSYTMRDVGQLDLAQLRRDYKTTDGILASVTRKSWKVAARLIGVTLIPAVLREPVAFDAVRDGFARLLIRQVATPRAWMSKGDPVARRT